MGEEEASGAGVVRGAVEDFGVEEETPEAVATAEAGAIAEAVEDSRVEGVDQETEVVSEEEEVVASEDGVDHQGEEEEVEEVVEVLEETGPFPVTG